MLRIPYSDLYAEMLRVLLGLGFARPRAERGARLFAEASRDGVASHGLNRFPRFVEMARSGVVDVQAEPVCVGSRGPMEQWDGCRGAGNLNAYACMERAIALARLHGLGCVALRNTNHWMRGGSYGWQAAEAGMIGLCWTNTMPNLPPWGARERRIGNNPLVIAVPRAEGHVVLDMALSQFSYGGLARYRLREEMLPVAGGFDPEGRLTHDPAAIEQSGRPLPIGYWKGSGLALLLDLTAALLSGGLATHQISADPHAETALSQVFIALDPCPFGEVDGRARLIDDVIAYVHDAAPAHDGDRIYYPGERTLLTRKANLERGIPVAPAVWHQVQAYDG